MTFPNFSFHGVCTLLCVITEVSPVIPGVVHTMQSVYGIGHPLGQPLSTWNPRPRCVEDEVLIAPQPPPPGGHGRSDLLPLLPPALGVESLEVPATPQLFTTFSPGSCRCRRDSRIPKRLVQTIPACPIAVEVEGRIFGASCSVVLCLERGFYSSSVNT